VLRTKEEKPREGGRSLGNDSGSTARLVFPGGRELLVLAIVASETVNARLDENEVELGVLVLAILLEMLAHGDSLLDEMVEILGDFRGETLELENAKDLVASNALDLRNTHGVTKSDTNLRRSHTLLGEFGDLLNHIITLDLDPRGSLTLIGQSTAAHTLTLTIHAAHAEKLRSIFFSRWATEPRF
jgi:hypothetical protein